MNHERVRIGHACRREVLARKTFVHRSQEGQVDLGEAWHQYPHDAAPGMLSKREREKGARDRVGQSTFLHETLFFRREFQRASVGSTPFFEVAMQVCG
jgi:hypothetical protein